MFGKEMINNFKGMETSQKVGVILLAVMGGVGIVIANQITSAKKEIIEEVIKAISK